MSVVVDARARRPVRARLRKLSRLRGWPLVALLILLPALLWLVDGPLGSRFGQPAAALRSLGIVAALTGAATFSVNLLLGARIPAIELVVGDLDRMYRVHRLLGYSVIVLLVCHALLITAGVAFFSLAGALSLFTPAGGWQSFLGVLALVVLVVVVMLPRVTRMKHESFLRLHRAVGLAFFLGIVHVYLAPGMRSQSPVLTTYLLGLMAAGAAAWVYRSVLGDYVVRRHHYRVAAVNRLDPTVAEIVLAPQGKPMEFRPGQFVFITVIDDRIPREPHPFSITSGQSSTALRLVVKALGDFTRQLQEMRPGVAVEVEGPFGGFSHLQVPNRHQVWIAGGIGVTPFLSMARSLESDDYEIDFYYCTIRADDAYFLDELFALADRHLRFRVIPFRQTMLGFITAKDIQGASGDLRKKDIFICGPLAMMRSLKEQFLSLGVPPEQIHFEDFGALSN